MISRRAILAFPAVLPFIPMAAKAEAAWTVEETLAEPEEHVFFQPENDGPITRGSCEGWIESYSAEWDIGHLKCFDDRPAFFKRDCVEKDELLVPGTKVMVYWSERPQSLRNVEMAMAWREALRVS